MAQTIQIKSSTTAGNVPSSLATGELAINVADGSLFFGSATTVYDDFRFGGLIVTGTTTLEGNSQLDGTLTVGVNDTGYDVKLFGATSGNYMLWDESENELDLVGNLNISGTTTYIGAISGTGSITAIGNLDIDGTSNLDNTDIDGTFTMDGTAFDVNGTTTVAIDNTNTTNGVTINTATSNSKVFIGHTSSETSIQDNLNISGDTTMNSSSQIFLDNGTAGDPAITFNVDRDTGFRYQATSQIRVSVAGTDQVAFSDGAIFPATTNDVNLGHSSNLYFKDLFIGSINCSGDISGGTLDISGDADIDGTTNLDVVDIDGAVQIDNTLTVGVDDTGYDVKFFGATAGKYMLWDEDQDSLFFPDNTKIVLGTGSDTEIQQTGSETIIKDASTGNIKLRAGTVTIQNGAASKTMAVFNGANSVDLHYNNNKKLETTNTGIDVTGEVKGDSLDIDGNSQLDGTLTVGVDDTGYDVKFFGDTASAYMLWDTSDDDLVLGGAATLKGSRRFEKSSTADKNLAQGDIIYVGGGSTIEGDLVIMTSAATWTSAQANAVTSGTSMLGIALGTDPDVDGVLLRGTYTLDHDVGNTQGAPLYLSDGTAGQATATIPDSSGDIVRIIGYNIGDDDEIWFDPDKTWVELS